MTLKEMQDRVENTLYCNVRLESESWEWEEEQIAEINRTKEAVKRLFEWAKDHHAEDVISDI